MLIAVVNSRTGHFCARVPSGLRIIRALQPALAHTQHTRHRKGRTRRVCGWAEGVVFFGIGWRDDGVI